MKKKTLVIILCLLPFVVSAQSIEYNEVDNFTGKPIICTSWTSLGTKAIIPSKSSPNLGFILRYENERIFFHLTWNYGANTIRKGSELQLKMSNGSIITLQATEDFTAKTEVYTLLDRTYSRSTMHAVYLGDLSALANNVIERIRLSTMYGSIVLELNTKNANKILKAYKLIMDELKNY